MARQAKTVKKTRRRHSDEFHAEALMLASKVGVAAAAARLGVQTSQLHAWRARAEMAKSKGEADQEMATELARLKRKLMEKDQEIAIAHPRTAHTSTRSGASRGRGRCRKSGERVRSGLPPQISSGTISMAPQGHSVTQIAQPLQ